MPHNNAIYIHIPFCRSKCFYCGFYSTVSPKMQESYIEALKQEIELRKAYLQSNTAKTLYLGGGTPSFISNNNLNKIIHLIENQYIFELDAERTIEMNPEDMTKDKLLFLKDIGFNRLSIGIQSFDNKVLKNINRTHSAEQAFNAIEQAAHIGFDNIGIDLIIGLPAYNEDNLESDLNKLLKLPIHHVSLYMLSIDRGSVFEKKLKTDSLILPDENLLARHYELASQFLKNNGFDHYEISNFSKDGKYSKHNFSYWDGTSYIGFGPSAHSYNLSSRQWNISNLKSYMESLNKGILDFDIEYLNDKDKYNEYVMTRLRTKWGADITTLEGEFGTYWKQSSKKVESYIQEELAKIEENKLTLTFKGWLISDMIFSDLFVI